MTEKGLKPAKYIVLRTGPSSDAVTSCIYRTSIPYLIHLTMQKANPLLGISTNNSWQTSGLPCLFLLELFCISALQVIASELNYWLTSLDEST